jgi:monoamine oxidase
MSRSLYARLHRRFGPRLSGPDRQKGINDRLDAYQSQFPTPVTLAEGVRTGSVVVIGGGLAGLMAGCTLASHFKVTLFEARERLGGRVRSLVDKTSKRITEAGAELIGYGHPTWLTLARHYGLGLAVWTSDDDFDALKLQMPMRLAGRLLSYSETEGVYNEMNAAFAKMAEVAKAIEHPWQAWLTPHAEDLDKMSLSEWIEGASREPLTRAALEVNFANTNGAPSNRQSYLANLALVAGAAIHGRPDDFFTLSENVRCAEGNDALARALASDIERRGGKVHLRAPVTRITIQKDAVLVKAGDADSIRADFAILAIPPSVWPSKNRSPLTIEPPIPEKCVMTMGTAVKYLSRSATRFWIAEGRAPSAASEECGMVWEGTDNQMQLPDQDVELSLFAGGDAADAAVRRFLDQGEEGVQRFYDERIGEMYSTYPERRRPKTDFVAWPLDPWTMSGYSCPAPGDVCRVGPNLARPHESRLYFAGEHACLPFFGYMEGALQSGRNVAHAILRL